MRGGVEVPRGAVGFCERGIAAWRLPRAALLGTIAYWVPYNNSPCKGAGRLQCSDQGGSGVP